MSDPVWPVSLPQDVFQGYRRGRPSGAVIASPVELGPPKTRPRFSAGAPRPLFVEVLLVGATAVGTFETFLNETLAYGALPFTWTDPLDGTTSLRLQFDPGQLDSVVVQHTGGDWHRVPLPLLVLEEL